MAQLSRRPCVLAHRVWIAVWRGVVIGLRRSWLVILGLAAVCLMATLASGASARSARKHRPNRVVLSANFHRVGSGYADVLTDGNYVFIVDRASTTGAQGGTLINDRTGQQRTISPPAGCAFPVIGGPWLLFANCGNQLQLFSLAGGRSRTVSRPSGYAPVAIGARWIEWEINCDGTHNCASYIFQDIETGQLRGDPTTAHPAGLELAEACREGLCAADCPE